MSQSGFHATAAVDFQRRLATEPRRQRHTTESAKKAYIVRHRREELEEAIALRHELEWVLGG